MNQYFADWLTRLSIARNRKSPNMISITGRKPLTAAPKAAPAIASSEIGVSNTRSAPCSDWSPPVTAKTPPGAATSSPKKTTLSSRASSSSRASRTALRNSSSDIGVPLSHHEAQRRLEPVADIGQETRRVGAVQNSVVTGERCGHELRDLELSVTRARTLLDRADREDCGLGRVDHGREPADAEHPEIGNGERAARELRRGDLALAHLVGERSRRSRDLAERLAIGVGDDWDDKCVLRRHRHSYVDALVELEATVVVCAVHTWVIPETRRTRLDDHVVDRRGRIRVLLELRAQRETCIHVDLDLDREVWNDGPRFRHARRHCSLEP